MWRGSSEMGPFTKSVQDYGAGMKRLARECPTQYFEIVCTVYWSPLYPFAEELLTKLCTPNRNIIRMLLDTLRLNVEGRNMAAIMCGSA